MILLNFQGQNCSIFYNSCIVSPNRLKHCETIWVQPSFSLRAVQKYQECNKRDVKSLEDLNVTNKPNKQTNNLPSIDRFIEIPKNMNSQFTLTSDKIPLTKWRLHCLVFPVFFSCDLPFSNSIRTFMSFLYVLLPLLWISAPIHSLLDFCWLYAFVLSLGCVYLCSHLPCTFDGWVPILDFCL